jgi:hypothetical protein
MQIDCVGNRQEGREVDVHVTPAEPLAPEVSTAVRLQLAHGRYPPSTLYGDGRVADRIADAPVWLHPYRQKRLHYVQESIGPQDRTEEALVP